MPPPRTDLSVVICTHNRKEQLVALLRSLAGQTLAPERLEVIVAADACHDGTVETLHRISPTFPYRLTILACRARRPATARNLGAASARGGILVFLDDDMIPCRTLLTEHLAAQETADVVIGYAKPLLPEHPTLWQRRARRWWEHRYSEMARPDHRFGYDDLFSGNVSIKHSLFRTLGGFDETLGRLEDYELGIRLVKEGARFGFAPEAMTFHQDKGNQDRWLDRLGMEGGTFVSLETKHPEMRGGFHRAVDRKSWSGRIRRLAGTAPRLGRGLVIPMRVALAVLEAVRARGWWERGIGALGEMHYWLGVTEAERLSTRETTPETGPKAMPFGNGAIPAPTHESPEVRLSIHGIPVLEVLPRPGYEPLSARHLEAPLSLLQTETWTDIHVSPLLSTALRACKAPVEIWRVDLSTEIESTPDTGGAASVCVAAFCAGTPLGFLPFAASEFQALSGVDLRRRLTMEFRQSIRILATRILLEETTGRPHPPTPPVSIVVTAGARAEDVRVCLSACAELDYPEYEVLVVGTGCHEAVVRDLVAGYGFTCGPMNARNRAEARSRGLALSSHPIVAFLDPPDTPERNWLLALANGFGDSGTAAVASQRLPSGSCTAAGRFFNAYCTASSGVDPFRVVREEVTFEDLRWLEESGIGLNLAVRKAMVAGTAPDAGVRAYDLHHTRLAPHLLTYGHPIWYEPAAIVRYPGSIGWNQVTAVLRARGKRLGWSLRNTITDIDHPPLPRRCSSGAAWIAGILFRGVREGILQRETAPLRCAFAQLRGAATGLIRGAGAFVEEPTTAESA